MKKSLLLVNLCGLCLLASPCLADVTVAPATGGDAISADTTGGSFTSLTGPTLTEGSTGDISTGDIVLNAPAGFEFDTSSTVTVAVSGIGAGDDIVLDSATATVTSSNITITVDSISDSGEVSILQYSGINVRPTAGTPLATGNITESGSATFTLVTLPADGYGGLVETSGAATQLAMSIQPSLTNTAGIVFGTQPAVTIEDAFGNMVGSDNSTAVSVARTDGGPLIGSDTIAISGTVTFTDVAENVAPTNFTLTFTATGLTPVVSSSVTIVPDVPDHLVIQQQPSSSASAGVAFATQPVIYIEDDFNNLVNTNVTVVASVTGGGSLQGGDTIITSNGVATFSTLSYSNLGPITIDFNVSGVPTVTSTTVTIIPGAADHLIFTQGPTSERAGHIFTTQPVVNVLDAFGHVVTNLTSSLVTISLTSGDGRLFGTKTVDVGASAGAGVATFTDLEINTAGNKQLTASYSGVTSLAGSTFTNAGTGQRYTLAGNYATGNSPHGIAFGNFRGQGTSRDMVVGNTGDDTAMVRLCNDDGTFTDPGTTYATGPGPVAPTFLDVDSDGNDEFVTANSGTNTVTVWKNSGHGVFGSHRDYAISANPNPGPVYVAVADLNGDGRLDIVTANANEGTISILFGTAGSTFTNLATYFVGNGPNSVFLADVDGDGKTDIVTANTTDNTFTILQNIGSGIFLAQTTLSVSPGGNPQPVRVLVTDLNKDGRKDIITINRGSNSVSVFTNDGAGSFVISTNYETGTKPTDFMFRDLDADGFTDLVVANSGSGTFTVFMNTGHGAFAEGETVAAGANSSSVAGSNFNGDGLTDLAVVNTDDTNVSVFLYTGPAPNSAMVTAYENRTNTITLTAKSLLPGTFSYSIAAGPTHGTLVTTLDPTKYNYIPNAGFIGVDRFYFRVSDGSITSGAGSIQLNVQAINIAPSFTLPVTSITVAEDAGLKTYVGFATNLNKGQSADAGQTLGFGVTNSNPGLFTNAPAISSTGTLTFQTAPNANGSATLGAFIYDNGGTNNGGVNHSAVQTFTITVTPVNDPPKFTVTPLPAKTVLEDGMLTTNFTLTDVDTPLASIVVTGTSSKPSLVPNTNIVATFNGVNWNLTVKPLTNANGACTIKLIADDQAGGRTTNTFALTVTAVNDAPSFTIPTNLLTVIGDTGLQTNIHFVTNIVTGPADEVAQTVTFTVAGADTNLFSTLPTISPKGNLTFVPKKGAVGTNSMTVRLKDSGGTANGGTNQSAAQSFTIAITTNDFWHITGNYSGLFYDSPVAEASAGLLKFNLTYNRVFSGSISIAGGVYSFSGKAFNTNGAVAFTVARAGKPTLTINLQLDLTNGTDQVSGTVANGTWTVPLRGDRAVTSVVNPTPGNYTMAFVGLGDGLSSPAGDGIADVKVSTNGTITLTGGTLADSAPFTASSYLSKNRQWPFYVSLYSGGGSVIGWIMFTNLANADMTGDLTWIKPVTIATFYPGGFTNSLSVIGSAFAIVPGVPALAANTGTIDLTGPTLATLVDDYLLTTNSTITVTTNHDHVSLTLTKTTGVITGTFNSVPTGNGTPIKGILIQKENRARGFFHTTHQSGDFLMQGY